MKKEIEEKYSEDGKFEVKEIILKHSGKVYSCIVAVDFNLLLKAQNALTDTNITNVNGEPKVHVQMNPMLAGDKVLFMGFKEGDKEIQTKIQLRRKACKMLGMWVQEMVEEEAEDEEEEKKS